MMATSVLPPIVVTEHNGILVVRDDAIRGGTKRRALPALMRGASEYVYASPAQGYAQVALAYASRDADARAIVFVAKRKQLHPRTAEAKAAGATIVQVPNGYLSVVRSRAKAYCEQTGAMLMPHGFDTSAFIAALADVALGTGLGPREVWSVAGSGVLTRALQQAWPNAQFHAVKIGGAADIGRAQLHVAPERFEQGARVPPPFPSCSNYDAKAWRFIMQHASPGALFWNVAA